MYCQTIDNAPAIFNDNVLNDVVPDGAVFNNGNTASNLSSFKLMQELNQNQKQHHSQRLEIIVNLNNNLLYLLYIFEILPDIVVNCDNNDE